MKKVLSFVLVLSMILGSFTMAFAAPADVVGTDYEDAVNVLTELGVVAGYKDGSYKPANIVTRAEMATFIIKAMGLNDYVAGKSEFTDMAGHWADPYVAYAVSLGFVKGNTDGTFAPDATVTYDQAITMLVQALGYKGEYLTGGYPGAFVNQAKTLGMLDGIKVGAAGANRGDVAILLFNTLNEAFVRYDNDGAVQTIYADRANGIADSMMVRLGASKLNNGAEFVVTGNEDSVIGLKEYQGALVTAYQNADGEIIAIEEVKTVFIKGDFDATAKTFTTTDDVEYKTERMTTAAIDKFVNGEAVTDAALTTSAKGITLAVKTSGKYISAVYSFAQWTAETPIQWTDALAEELAEKDTLNSKAFAMTDSDEIDMDEVVVLGVESLDKIAEDNVVTYYLAGNKVVKVEVGTEVVEGKVTKVTSDLKKATINGKVYDVTSAGAVATGEEGKFFLNYDGDIEFKDTTLAAATDYAMVTFDMGSDANVGYAEDSILKVKLVTADGKEKVYVVDEDATSNGAIVSGQAVSYKLDKDGEIEQINNVTEAMITADAIMTAKGYLDGYKVSDKVVVFQADGEGSYDVVDLKAVPTNDAAKIAGSYYVLNSDKEVVVIILAQSVVADEDAVYGVLVGYENALDADDKDIYEVSMLVDGAAKTYVTKNRSVVLAVTKAALYKVEFDGTALKELKTVTAASIDGTTVAAVKDGNIQMSGYDKYVEVAGDVVVYLVNEDGDMEASTFAKIAKKDTIVAVYEMDGEDDENGIDVVIFEKAK